MHYIDILSKDKVMVSLIAQFGEIPPIVPVEDLFQDIIRSIVGQQLSVKAADTIYGRVLNLVGTSEPGSFLKHEDAALRACGLSFAKIKYIKSLCESVLNKEVDLESLRNLKDEEVIEELVKLKGIGVWTAEMLLIFGLGKEDIFSYGDLGVRNAISNLYKVDRDNREKIMKIQKKWAPFRSYACRYLWKSLDNLTKK
jgi:DNA-3-methyladenine glycosylase II